MAVTLETIKQIIQSDLPDVANILHHISTVEESSDTLTLNINVFSLSPESRAHHYTQLNKVLKTHFPNLAINLKFTSEAPQPKQDTSPPSPQSIPGVKKIIAVASGKGGVGKSAVAALLSVASAKLGLKTGLIDADIYGPSQSQIFGISSKPQVDPTSDKMLPIRVGNVDVMSFSFFIEPLDPVIWRGPMIMKVLQQFFFEVHWGDKDLVIIDLPPGTGDAQLSMTQYINLSGALLVTTPQTISVIDAVKGSAMFQKLNIPVLGVVENMSTFLCPTCCSSHHLFQSGGGAHLADLSHSEVLSQLPLIPDLCALLDAGEVFKAATHPTLQDAFEKLMKAIAQKIELPLPESNPQETTNLHPKLNDSKTSWFSRVFQR